MSPRQAVQKLEANMVIMGGGGGGLTAALTAAENGVTGIVLLEKLRKPGGNSALAHGLFACESPVQKREMVDCRADDCFKTLMNWAHWSRVEAPVARAYFNKSGETIRWLEGKGLEFELRTVFPNQVPVWHNPAGRGAYLIEVLIKECQERGVAMLLQTAAKKILRDAKGRISGVLATKESGEELEIKTGCVVIATGGFAGNKELLKKYCPSYHDNMRLAAIPLTGDGLLMAQEAGAATAQTVPLVGGGRGGPDIKMSKVLKTKGVGSLMAIANEPYTIWINKKGKRFTDEGSFVSDNAGALQPERVTYTVFDDSIRQDMEENGIRVGMGSPQDVRAQRRGLPGLKNELLEKEAESNGKSAKICDSWEEMGAWLGAAPGVLQATVDEYNAYCAQGYDAAFAKERRYLRPLRQPPYYALRCTPSFHDTAGGIKVTGRMEVRDMKDDVIPGLYAAGVLPDGWETEDYCWILCGSAFGFAINSGRIAGENAAAYLKANAGTA